MSKCESCRYSFKVGCGQSKAVSYGCDFINMTGELRGCPAGDECTRYMELVPVDPNDHKPYESNPFHSKFKRKVVKNMAKLTEQNKRDIITKRNCGASLPALAREYKVSPQAISDVCKKYDKLGESMFGAPAQDAQTENEPATVGAVTSSETEIVVENISEDIVTPSEENVKPDVQTDSTPAALSPVIPDSVLEACRERKANLLSDIRGWEQSIADWKAQVKELDDFMEVARLCNPMGGGKI